MFNSSTSTLQVHAAMGALLRDNGQDHQRAFLDGEGIIGLLKPGAQQPKAKSLLGLTNKDKQHAATRAGDRALQVRDACYDEELVSVLGCLCVHGVHAAP